jgi:hypothetical protein
MQRTAPVATIAALLTASANAQSLAHTGAQTDVSDNRCKAVIGDAIAPYTEETAARGISYFIGNPDNNYATAGMGSASFADLDRDGDADIICVGAWDGRVAVYENDGAGYFTERPANVPFAFDASGVIAGDYDGDKDLDLFISCFLGDDVLLRNDGGFVFTDVTAQAGVGGSLGTGGGSAWGDVNGDGFLDLYVANRTGSPIFSKGTLSDDPNRLFINQGDGTFIDQYTQLGLNQGDQPTLVGAFIDFDLDGDLDIYEGNDKGTLCFVRSNYLWENVGGTFVDITAQSNTESCTDTMGIGIGDFDGNGWPDIYCTHTPGAPGNALMMNNGDGTFAMQAPYYGVDSLALSWGCAFFDHDNDGDLALYVNNVFEPDRLYDFQGAWPAVDIAPEMNIHSDGKAYNVSLADIDLDGDLDHIISTLPGYMKLYINHQGELNNYAQFKVMGAGANQHAIGAHIRVRTGDKWQSAQVLAGGNNYRSQNELARHFGLGGECTVDEIEVRWPDGATRTMTDYPANARYTIYRVAQLGDPDGDGSVSLDEVRGIVDATGPVRQGTEVYDMNGDGVVDLVDLTTLVRKAMSDSPLSR